MFYCDKCGNGDCCERLDILKEPVLCDKCYEKARAVQNIVIFVCCLTVIVVAGLLAV